MARFAGALARKIAVGMSGCLLVAGATTGWAETVSYSIPVLVVKSDGQCIVPGSGTLSTCPFSFVETTNVVPVRVSIVEDGPSGAGDELRSSLWLAVTTAALTMNRSLSGTKVYLETSGSVDGPSAGAMCCLAVMSAMDGRPFPDDFAMTGTIMADGTIGPVGSIAEKIRAAGRAGIRRVCIPSFSRMDEDATDLLGLGTSLKIEMHQVSTIAEAYRILHRLPVRPVARLNPLDICQLPPQVEEVLKQRFSACLRECPRGGKTWNRAHEVYTAGCFGAAMVDILKFLEERCYASRSVDTPDAAVYPLLAHEFPSTGDRSPGGTPSRKRYEEALKAFHRDLKAVDDAFGTVFQEANDAEDREPGPSDDWFDDYVEPPNGAQFATFVNNYLAKLIMHDRTSRTISEELDALENWTTLDAAGLNRVRAQLVEKLNAQTFRSSFDEGGENYARLNALFVCLRESIPFFRPNANVRQVEDVFYRTVKAMDAKLGEHGLQGDRSVAACRYRSLFNLIEAIHGNTVKEKDTLYAVFSEVQTLSEACALVMCQTTESTGRGGGNSVFYSSVVATARENALENISDCRKSGIPCVMPVICFQLAESSRDACAAADVADSRFTVLANYLQASLSAKALVLCFAGQKPELNAKGYCCKHVTDEIVDDHTSCLTVRYLGVDGKPILRGGFSGYRKIYNDAGVVFTGWLGLDGRDVRFKSANGCWTLTYDASDRSTTSTHCDDSWVPTPQKDGVLFETFGYDADGNRISSEYFGASSNRVARADGTAVVRSRFNTRRQEVWRRYYGVREEPVADKDGSAGFDAVFDKNGNLRACTYVDCRGSPVMTAKGYAREECKYDVQDHEIEHAWYDAHGRLVCVEGVAKIRRTYDDRGNMTSEAYFGDDDHSKRGADEYASVRYTVNEEGVPTECRYYGPDGRPTRHKGGYALWKSVLDESGQVVGRRYYDLAGKEIDGKL